MVMKANVPVGPNLVTTVTIAPVKDWPITRYFHSSGRRSLWRSVTRPVKMVLSTSKMVRPSALHLLFSVQGHHVATGPDKLSHTLQLGVVHEILPLLT